MRVWRLIVFPKMVLIVTAIIVAQLFVISTSNDTHDCTYSVTKCLHFSRVITKCLKFTVDITKIHNQFKSFFQFFFHKKENKLIDLFLFILNEQWTFEWPQHWNETNQASFQVIYAILLFKKKVNVIKQDRPTKPIATIMLYFH